VVVPAIDIMLGLKREAVLGAYEPKLFAGGLGHPPVMVSPEILMITLLLAGLPDNVFLREKGNVFLPVRSVSSAPLKGVNTTL
jgi:hypothetical protein